MTEKDLTQFSAADVQETPDELNAAVTYIGFTTAKDVYGEKLPKGMDEAEVMLHIMFENDAFNVKGDLKWKFYDKPVPEHSIQGKYLKKYNNLLLATVLQIKKSKSGFFRVVLE